MVTVGAQIRMDHVRIILVSTLWIFTVSIFHCSIYTNFSELVKLSVRIEFEGKRFTSFLSSYL